MNRIGRLAIFAVLLIVALLVHLAGVWSRLGIAGQSTLNRT
jgi:hypothetical protein